MSPNDFTFQALVGEAAENLPAVLLDPLLRFKIDVWHAAQMEALRRLKADLAKGPRPLRVMFLTPDTSLWDVFASVYSDMSAHPEFEPSVLAFKRRGATATLGAAETSDFYEERGVRARLVGFDDVEPAPLSPADADILFYTLGSAAFPPALQMEFTSLSFLTCYLPYGFLLAREYEYQFNQEFHHAAWRLFAATEREEALYRRYAHRRENAVALTGYPKFDTLYGLPADPEARPSVVWAPHWTIGAVYPRLNLGMFDRICMDMLKIFDDFPQVDFIYKPHPTLAHALEQTSFMSGKNYAIYLAMLEARPNVRVWMHGDYADIFARSAAMITDSVSFLAEYLLADRPLLFLERPDRARLSPTGEEIIAMHYTGANAADIRAFLKERALGGDDPHRAKRAARAGSILGIGAERASARIIAVLEKAIIGDAAPPRTRVFGVRKPIDRRATLQFFEQRARTFRDDQPYVSTLYQDAAPGLAEARDAAEKARILPRLALQAHLRLLDIGCGVGRWADAVLPFVGAYVGADASPGLIRLARQRRRDRKARFVVADAAQIASVLDPATAPFDRFIISGLLLYLNDEEVRSVAAGVAALSAPGARLYLREPLALDERLTLDRHWSAELNAEYSAIYRTRAELSALIEPALRQAGFAALEFEPLYDDPALENRSETRQFFSLCDRAS